MNASLAASMPRNAISHRRQWRRLLQRLFPARYSRPSKSSAKTTIWGNSRRECPFQASMKLHISAMNTEKSTAPTLFGDLTHLA